MSGATDKTKATKTGTSKSKRGGKRSNKQGSVAEFVDLFSGSATWSPTKDKKDDERSHHSKSKLAFEAPFSSKSLFVEKQSSHFVGASDDECSVDEELFSNRAARRNSVESTDFENDMGFDQFQQQYNDNDGNGNGNGNGATTNDSLEESFSWTKPGKADDLEGSLNGSFVKDGKLRKCGKDADTLRQSQTSQDPSTPARNAQYLDIDTNTPLGVAGTYLMAPSSSSRGRSSSRARSRTRPGSARSRSRARGKSQGPDLQSSSSNMMFESSFSTGLNVDDEEDFNFHTDSLKESTNGSTRRERTTRGHELEGSSRRERTSDRGRSKSRSRSKADSITDNGPSSPSKSSRSNVTRIRIKTNGRKLDPETAKRLVAEKMQQMKEDDVSKTEDWSQSMTDFFEAETKVDESALFNDSAIFDLEAPESPTKSTRSTSSRSESKESQDSKKSSQKKSKKSSKGLRDFSKSSDGTSETGELDDESSRKEEDKAGKLRSLIRQRKAEGTDPISSPGASSSITSSPTRRKKQNPFLERFLGAASGNLGTVFDQAENKSRHGENLQQKKIDIQDVDQAQLEAAVRAAMASKVNGGDITHKTEENDVLSHLVQTVLEVSSSMKEDKSKEILAMGEVAIDRDSADTISTLGGDESLTKGSSQYRYEKSKEFGLSQNGMSKEEDEGGRRSQSKSPKKKTKKRSDSPEKKTRSGRSKSPTKKSTRDRSVSPQKRNKVKEYLDAATNKKDKRSKSRAKSRGRSSSRD